MVRSDIVDFGDDRRGEILGHLFVVGNRRHHTVGDIDRLRLVAVGMMRLQPPFVTSEALFEPIRSNVERRSRFLGLPAGLQRDTGVQPDHAVRREA